MSRGLGDVYKRQLYDRSMATFNADASFSQGAAPGFIELFSLQSRMAYRIAEARRKG